MTLAPVGAALPWAHYVVAFRNDEGALCVAHAAPGSADGGATLVADDASTELTLNPDTPPEVADLLRRIANEVTDAP